MELNKVHNINFLENTLPDKCADLIIADPPYFEVKGEFDFIWSSFEDYLIDVEKWVVECKRLLAHNGTLLWYGNSKKIAYSQIIIDKHFNLLSNITIHFTDKRTNIIKKEDARSFLNSSEHLLMYSKYSHNSHSLNSIRDYIREEIIKSKGKISFKEINSALGTATNGGGVASACFSLNKEDPTMITYDMYKKLQIWLFPYLTKPYNTLRSEFELNIRPFNPIEQYKMDVLRFSYESHISGLYEHDTVKPEKLTRCLIQTCSRVGDLVVVPFAGSGTECAMSIKEHRKTIGFDISEKHCKTSNDRIKKIISRPELFAPEELFQQTQTLF